MSEPDWKQSEATLFEKGKEAIARFASEHPDEICSFFAIYSDFCYGEVSFTFDTLDNSLLQAKRHEQRLVRQWREWFGKEADQRDPKFFRRAWELAYTTFSSPVRGRQRIDDYNTFDAFKYEAYSLVEIADWRECFENMEVSEDSTGIENEASSPDPFEGNVILVIWNVIERLINEDVFSQLSLSSPFRLGFRFHDSELVVLRILNWPPHKGARV